MNRYIALLRGINVGGNNKISMTELKKTLEDHGFLNVITYLNSGNVIFDSEETVEMAVKSTCEELILEQFSLNITVGIISSIELSEALAHMPDWWNSDPKSKHNAIFVIPPMTASEVCTQVAINIPEYEKIHAYGKVILWSAPISTFSRTRLSQIVQTKKLYNAITIRNANTTLKLASLAKTN